MGKEREQRKQAEERLAVVDREGALWEERYKNEVQRREYEVQRREQAETSLAASESLVEVERAKAVQAGKSQVRALGWRQRELDRVEQLKKQLQDMEKRVRDMEGMMEGGDDGGRGEVDHTMVQT